MANSTTFFYIPKWITILSSLIALLGLFVGASLYISPGTFMPEINFSLPGITYLTNMWAARQVAIGFIIGYSVIRQSGSMLSISLTAYSIMNIQDTAIGIAKQDQGLIIGASLFCILSAIMIFVLNKSAK